MMALVNMTAVHMLMMLVLGAGNVSTIIIMYISTTGATVLFDTIHASTLQAQYLCTVYVIAEKSTTSLVNYLESFVWETLVTTTATINELFANWRF